MICIMSNCELWGSFRQLMTCTKPISIPNEQITAYNNNFLHHKHGKG